MIRHLLKINDVPRSELGQLLLRAKELKDNKIRNNALEGKTVIMILKKLPPVHAYPLTLLLSSSAVILFS